MQAHEYLTKIKGNVCEKIYTVKYIKGASKNLTHLLSRVVINIRDWRSNTNMENHSEYQIPTPCLRSAIILRYLSNVQFCILYRSEIF